jgi:hypothetical protein
MLRPFVRCGTARRRLICVFYLGDNGSVSFVKWSDKVDKDGRPMLTFGGGDYPRETAAAIAAEISELLQPKDEGVTIDRSLPAFPLGKHAPRECPVCHGPMGFDVERNLLSCATITCERYGKRILWMSPTLAYDAKGNIVEP